tara:strand:+ start:1874 stop:2485 length:612 start_codon:yes stop_codon:yes gene_type:complete
MNKPTIGAAQEVFSLDSVNFFDVASWNRVTIVSLFLATFIAVFSFGYYFIIDTKLQELSDYKNLQPKLINEFGKKYALVSNKEPYQKQKAELDLMFSSFLEKVPVDAQVPETLENITTVASGSGLVTSNISLQPPVDLGLYFELPMDIQVEGSYHNLAEFVAGLTQLRRLVSLHNFSLKTTVNGDLALNLGAKTYQFNKKNSS